MAISLTDAILIGLAAYRVATDLAWEDGPADLYSRIRGAAYQRWGDGWQARGWTCPICLSFWAAIVLGAVWLFAPVVVAVLAAAGVAALLARVGRAPWQD